MYEDLVTTVGTCQVYGKKPQVEYPGYIEKCFYGEETYAAFYNIRYGEAPKGTKLFQAPEPVKSTKQTNGLQTNGLQTNGLQTNGLAEGGPTPSSSIANPTPSISTANSTPSISSAAERAAIEKNASLQPPKLDKPKFDGSLDCLFLNVYVPKDPNCISKLLPVLVYIHGGGLKEGSNNPALRSPEDIVQQELVFVSINYRLGAYGFHNERTKEIPGNAGVKDQVLALKWIRDNIECFKGDPKNVTLCGVSAGATCVNAHLVCPMSKDLFHKAILMAGGLFWPWGYKGHQFARKNLFSRYPRVRELRFKEEESQIFSILSCDLVQKDFDKRHPQSFSSHYGLTVEKYRKGAFIPDDIEKMMEVVVPDKPVMAGMTKNEALEQFLSLELHPKMYIQDDQEFLQFLMDNFRWSKDTAIKCAGEIKDKYFPADPSNMTLEEEYVCVTNLIHDIFVRRFYDGFKFGPDKTLQENLFVYQFDHVSEISRVRIQEFDYLEEATHGDDDLYLHLPAELRQYFQHFIYEGESQNREIREVVNHMCSLWANFCRDGIPKSDFDPNVVWRPYTKEKPCYLKISNNLVLKEGSVLSERCTWLDEFVSAQPIIPSQKNSPESEVNPNIENL